MGELEKDQWIILSGGTLVFNTMKGGWVEHEVAMQMFGLETALSDDNIKK